MNLLLDTHVLLWAAISPDRLSPEARGVIADPTNMMVFSAASIWEVAIKQALGRQDFTVDPRQLRRGLLENGYTELSIMGRHAAAVTGLPPLHRDPFDRILVAQSTVEAMTMLTADAMVARYSSLIRLV